MYKMSQSKSADQDQVPPVHLILFIVKLILDQHSEMPKSKSTKWIGRLSPSEELFIL